MGHRAIALASAALFVALASRSRHAEDAVCARPTEIAGFATCADVAKAEQEGKLVIYSTDVEQGQAKIVAAFNTTLPKIKPTYVRALSASLYAKLQSERQAGRYLVDLVNVDVVLANDFLKRNGGARYVSPQMSTFRPEAMVQTAATLIAVVALLAVTRKFVKGS